MCSFTSQDVIGILQYLFALHGRTCHLRSRPTLHVGTRSSEFGIRSPEFVAKSVRHWLERSDAKTLLVAQGSPWKNGYIESAGGKLRDEFFEPGILPKPGGSSPGDRSLATRLQQPPYPQFMEVPNPVVFAAGCILLASATPPEHSRFSHSPWYEDGGTTTTILRDKSFATIIVTTKQSFYMYSFVFPVIPLHPTIHSHISQ